MVLALQGGDAGLISYRVQDAALSTGHTLTEAYLLRCPGYELISSDRAVNRSDTQ